ncbi:MAG: NAD+ synthase [Campylobacterota bacterium]|nr:NAD+ synthase [Campylobacterota bacterium]
MNYKNIKQQMIDFLKDETSKIGIKNVTIGLSGGLDSAVVAVLVKEVFKDNMSVVLMPSQFSSKESITDAKELCKKFDINYEIIDISPMVKGYFNSIDNATPLRIGNFSARMRMSVLYDISARDNSLVIGTSNKSEILLGYGTLYGDTACAINPIGQIYKSDLFEFAKYIGVTDTIINKKPSADLWEGQSDEDELGFTYKEMDNVLKLMIDKKLTKEQLLEKNIEEKLIDMLDNRVKSNLFKGRLPTIANINFNY